MGNNHVCLTCFAICDGIMGIEGHLASMHPLTTVGNAGQLDGAMSVHQSDDDLPLGATYETPPTSNNRSRSAGMILW